MNDPSFAHQDVLMAMIKQEEGSNIHNSSFSPSSFGANYLTKQLPWLNLHQPLPPVERCTCDRSVLALSMLQECASIVSDPHHDDVDMLTTSRVSSGKLSDVGKTPSAVSVRDLDQSCTTTANISTQQHCSVCHKSIATTDSQPQHPLPVPHSDEHSYPEDSFAFWRQQMFDWSCMVIDSYGMTSNRTLLLATTFGFLDRHVAREVSTRIPVTRDDFQLFGMTSLYMALKLHGACRLTVGSLVHMSRGFYSEQDITVTELELLQSCHWRLHTPTAACFSQIILEEFVNFVKRNETGGREHHDNNDNKMEERYQQLSSMCQMLVELSIADASLVGCRASVVGLAAVLLAARLVTFSEACVQNFLSRVRLVLGDAVSEQLLQTTYRQLEALYMC